MSLLSLFAFTVFAAETIISPLPDATPQPTVDVTTKPQISFGEITVTPTPRPKADQPLAETPARIASQSDAGGAKKSHYTIALLGDSMIDTLGPGVPALQNLLKSSYPGTTFTIVNYGVGATNMSYGLERLTHDYDYLGSHMPSLVSQKPDIVVVESFGYNPYSDAIGGLDKQWQTLAAIKDVVGRELPGAKLIIAGTIAPNATVFGDGAPGISFGQEDKRQRVSVIKQYIENALRFASGEHIPVADAYHPSLQNDGNGNLAYINAGDHIHYSDSGRALFARQVFRAMQSVL